MPEGGRATNLPLKSATGAVVFKTLTMLVLSVFEGSNPGPAGFLRSKRARLFVSISHK